ncbi:hypothetical protein TGMAS_416930 [Toxoplasma gondii MAS]|uniref:Uncharacterized protein n=1 Tax=Toxoplasma gondii MAS TaxID=943118 RepID=A0A086PQY4_TOXGO|nr:hypothetical protein TGMAS_416930 [Toxoplasma gondii MAS]
MRSHPLTAKASCLACWNHGEKHVCDGRRHPRNAGPSYSRSVVQRNSEACQKIRMAARDSGLLLEQRLYLEGSLTPVWRSDSVTKRKPKTIPESSRNETTRREDNHSEEPPHGAREDLRYADRRSGRKEKLADEKKPVPPFVDLYHFRWRPSTGAPPSGPYNLCSILGACKRTERKRKS